VRHGYPSSAAIEERRTARWDVKCSNKETGSMIGASNPHPLQFFFSFLITILAGLVQALRIRSAM
jgi:hypothetical protein